MGLKHAKFCWLWGADGGLFRDEKIFVLMPFPASRPGITLTIKQTMSEPKREISDYGREITGLPLFNTLAVLNRLTSVPCSILSRLLRTKLDLGITHANYFRFSFNDATLFVITIASQVIG